MGKPAIAIELSAAKRRELESLVRRRKTSQGLARRARIVLAAAEGLENKAIVEAVGADANTVGKWRRRRHVGPCVANGPGPGPLARMTGCLRPEAAGREK